MIQQSFAAPRREPLEAFAKVHRILDGDTVDVRINNRIVRIRLDGIDCPEDDQPWGDTATAGLVKMIGGREIRLEIRGQDRYRRSLGTIFVTDKDTGAWTNVNARMVMLGHAWVYRQFCSHLPRNRQGELYQLERWAQSREVGLWSTDNPVPPWKWRNGGVPQCKGSSETELVNYRRRLREPHMAVVSRREGYRQSRQGAGPNKAVRIFVIILVLVLAGVAGWFYYGDDLRFSSFARSSVADSPATRATGLSGSSGAEPTRPAQPTCRIKGNINWQGERIYYLPGTSFYGTAVINPDKGERWFCSEEEAMASGWRAPKPIQSADED